MPKSVTDQDLWSILKANAPASISMNHYELAMNTEIQDPEIWKKFLNKPNVSDWIKEEQAMLQKAELAKLSIDVANSRSVGQAQLISAMERVNAANENQGKKGPIFIYCYVPANTQQKHSDAYQELDHDIFLKDTEERSDDDAPAYTF